MKQISLEFSFKVLYFGIAHIENKTVDSFMKH